MVLETLRRARKENKYSVKEMSDTLNISQSYYYQIENGKRKLDYAMAVKISSIFGLKPDDMFYFYFNRDLKKIKSKRNNKQLSVKFIYNNSEK